MTELVLGTVQFGMNYGVTNTSGKVSSDRAQEILELAANKGVSILDTAQAYGDSEEMLADANDFEIVTKVTISALEAACLSKNALIETIAGSLKRLNRETLKGVMLHNADGLLGDQADAVYAALSELKEQGLAQKIGISVYDPQQLVHSLERFNIDIVQLPSNVFDQRFNIPVVSKAITKNATEVHARSLFLQGSLLTSGTPKKLMFADAHFRRFRQFCLTHELSPLEACIAYGKQNTLIDGLVVGVTTAQELQEISDAFEKPYRGLDFLGLRVDDEELVNPAKWPN